MHSRSPRALIDTPPFWLLAAVGLAWAQAKVLPLWPSPQPLRTAGAAVILLGLLLLAAAALQFRRHRTSIVPRETPAALLTSGPYRLSRNPIYLADALILLGLILMWDLASLPLVPAFVTLISRRFIAGEEAGCRTAFGPAWDAYRRAVRRWL